jgi:hypothetical protein
MREFERIVVAHGNVLAGVDAATVRRAFGAYL